MSTPIGYACDECGAVRDMPCAVDCEGVAEPYVDRWQADACVDCAMACEGYADEIESADWDRGAWLNAVEGSRTWIEYPDDGEPAADLTHFSWVPCALCGSTLGGARVPVGGRVTDR